MSVKLVSPRMLLEFARAPEDVLVVYELGLVGLYAGLSKLFRRDRKVISLVEGDYRHIGRTGTAAFKLARPPARGPAASTCSWPTTRPARDYLSDTLNVPEDKIIVGWWLAGLPADLAPRSRPARRRSPRGRRCSSAPAASSRQRASTCVIRALAAYRRRVRPVRALGHRGRPRAGRLVQLSRRLHVEDSVTFLGRSTIRPQGRPPGLPGVRVPDPAGLHRPRRGGGAERRYAGDRVADDGSGRHDRA